MYVKKRKTTINKELPEVICIDDFAIKKRQKYGTIMVDAKTGRVIDLIESRELEDVKNWLMSYPNIKMVSRDGSPTYAKAIAEAHPQAIQISDRFHIIKNLCERSSEYLQKMFGGRISIPLTDGTKQLRRIMSDGTAEQQVETIKALHKQGKSKEEIRLMTGTTIKTINRYIKAKDSKSIRGRQHTEAVEKVQMKADLVKKLKADGFNITSISQQTGFTRERVKKYLSESFEPVNAHYGNRREGKLAQYRDLVIQMYREGHAYKVIFCHIKALGYRGTEDAIRGFVSKEKRIQADFLDSNTEELLERKWLVQLLYKPFSEVKGITVEQLNAVKLKYPAVEKIYSIIAEFRSAFISGVPDLLTEWMKKTKTFEITELNSFISGLERDNDAVKNAMLYSFNNGLAEGSVNKLKVVKRIMYGRCSFGLLKSKLLALDYWRHFN